MRIHTPVKTCGVDPRAGYRFAPLPVAPAVFMGRHFGSMSLILKWAATTDHTEHAHHGNKAHSRLTATGVVSFLVLCFPIALNESYGQFSIIHMNQDGVIR
jgi:hypothetical protein